MLVFGSTKTFHRVAVAIEDAGFEIRDTLFWLNNNGYPKSRDIAKDVDRLQGVERPVIGMHQAIGFASQNVEHGQQSRTRTQYEKRSKDPITDAAKQWEHWGTGLKPAAEPIILARKPISETNIANNVLVHGTGGLNIGACKVQGDDGQERWPANVLIDGSAEVQACFDAFEVSGERFFFCSRVGKEERSRSGHPTVKPLDLIKYCIRLITPRGGLVLDPFGGSGTTGEAALAEDVVPTLIEIDAGYHAYIEARLGQHAAGHRPTLLPAA